MRDVRAHRPSWMYRGVRDHRGQQEKAQSVRARGFWSDALRTREPEYATKWELMDHSPDILAALSQLPSRRGDVLQRAQLMVLAGGGNLYKVDLFTIGAAKRTVSLSAGFEALVKAYNIVCARSDADRHGAEVFRAIVGGRSRSLSRCGSWR